MNIDTENAKNYYSLVGGRKALVSEKNGRVFVTWAIDRRYFLIDYSGSSNEALRIAQSVKMIK